ncbi:hypothetical protein B0T19DRAFT_57384 [Cercophora scortea]|uniref:Uncharacterized protein n=1 Tax=Cercophora scortea TaxID=314031 RepID=A0AAE0J5N2_9PEZI|nr:hypothetical protein B0T19DRAFT_57384 [Cercophora scortea]
MMGTLFFSCLFSYLGDKRRGEGKHTGKHNRNPFLSSFRPGRVVVSQSVSLFSFFLFSLFFSFVMEHTSRWCADNTGWWWCGWWDGRNRKRARPGATVTFSFCYYRRRGKPGFSSQQWVGRKRIIRPGRRRSDGLGLYFFSWNSSTDIRKKGSGGSTYIGHGR